MKKNITNYALHLDKVRKSYKITVEQLCEGICMPRQFRRYKSGINNLPYDKLIMFCENIGIPLEDFFYSYKEKSTQEYKDVLAMYRLIRNNQFDEYLQSDYISLRSSLTNVTNIKWIDYCTEKALYAKHRKHRLAVLDTITNILDYPNCLIKDAFDFVDILYLVFIAELEILSNQTKALDRLKEILTNPKMMYLSIEKSSMYASIYANVALLLCRQHKYVESLEVANQGITYSISHNHINALAHLRYVRSYSLKMLGQITEAEKEAIKCVMTTIALDHLTSTKLFYKELKDDFNLDPYDLISKYKSDLLGIK